jgi:hypothetical protein
MDTDASSGYTTAPTKSISRSTGGVSIGWVYDGNVNDEPVDGKGMMSFNAEGEFEASIIFDKFPTTIAASNTGNSLLSISCANVAKEIAGAVNMLSLTGGNYQGYRSFVVRDPKGEIAGALVVTLGMRRKDGGI